MNLVNFLNRRFKKLHATCDVAFRSLHAAGIGTETKSAKLINKCTEDELWKTGVLNSNTPTGLHAECCILLIGQNLLFERGRIAERIETISV